MNDIAYIRNRVSQEVFDYQILSDCLRNYKKPRDRIQRIIASKDIVRIRKGLYAFAEPYRKQAIVREQLANLIYGPSYVSLETALSFHGLIPERVATVTSVAGGRSREFSTPFGVFTYRHLSSARYAVGAIMETRAGMSFLIASPEKALADKIWMDKRFPGTLLRDFGPYLTDDLRIEIEALNALDAKRLDAIAKAYASLKISNLLHFLRNLRRMSDA